MLNSLKIYTDIPFTHPYPLPPSSRETLSGSTGEILIEKLFSEPSFRDCSPPTKSIELRDQCVISIFLLRVHPWKCNYEYVKEISENQIKKSTLLYYSWINLRTESFFIPICEYIHYGEVNLCTRTFSQKSENLFDESIKSMLNY